MTEVQAPVTAPAPAAFELPELTSIPTPEKKVGAPKLPNPWIDKLKTLELDITGKSKETLQFRLSHEAAKAHITAIRRAARELGIGVSVPPQKHDDGTSTVSVTVMPKRERNTATGGVDTPDAQAPESAVAAKPAAPVKAAAK